MVTPCSLAHVKSFGSYNAPLTPSITYFSGSIRFSSIARLKGVPWVYFNPPKYVSQVSEWESNWNKPIGFSFPIALKIGRETKWSPPIDNGSVLDAIIFA